MRAIEFLNESKIVEYEGIKLNVGIDGQNIDIRALRPDGHQIGYVVFDRDGQTLVPDDLSVDEKYQGQGIAKVMYDYVKSLGFRIEASPDQTEAGAGFWEKHRGEERVWEDEEVLDEMPLPVGWDPAQMQQQGTSFKSRLAYALERAKKIGAGSSRVAMTIDYQGRPTVLKVAKNAKGLAQNSVEADILSDGYGSQIGIMIPIIDYDEQHREPLWLHTELAQKANEQQLCRLMKCDSLMQLVRFGNTIAGKYRGQTAQQFIDDMINDGKSEQDVEICTDYANKLADLANSFDVELADFARPANWGIYNGNPVVIDVGFNSNVMNQYYKR